MASLVTIAAYYDRSSAVVAWSMLDQHGICAILLDADFASVQWPLVLAIGGIRLAVPDAEREMATTLLGIEPDRRSVVGEAIDVCLPPLWLGRYLSAVYVDKPASYRTVLPRAGTAAVETARLPNLSFSLAAEQK